MGNHQLCWNACKPRPLVGPGVKGGPKPAKINVFSKFQFLQVGTDGSSHRYQCQGFGAKFQTLAAKNVNLVKIQPNLEKSRKWLCRPRKGPMGFHLRAKSLCPRGTSKPAIKKILSPKSVPQIFEFQDRLPLKVSKYGTPMKVRRYSISNKTWINL